MIDLSQCKKCSLFKNNKLCMVESDAWDIAQNCVNWKQGVICINSLADEQEYNSIMQRIRVRYNSTLFNRVELPDGKSVCVKEAGFKYF